MLMMLIESLTIFCDLVESGSFSRAPTSNIVSQSAVSQQIKNIQKAFGITLCREEKRSELETSRRILYGRCGRENGKAPTQGPELPTFCKIGVEALCTRTRQQRCGRHTAQTLI